MPAVSPPATASNCSKPTSRAIGRDAEIDQRVAHARKRDRPAAIGVDRARQPEVKMNGLSAVESDGLDLEQHLGGEFRDVFLSAKLAAMS